MTREELCICACKYAIGELTRKGSYAFITSAHAGRQQISWVEVVEWLKDYKGLLEQEPILDKIRAEIFSEIQYHSGTGEEVIQAYVDGLNKGLIIIDKYKAEREDD